MVLNQKKKKTGFGSGMLSTSLYADLTFLVYSVQIPFSFSPPIKKIAGFKNEMQSEIHPDFKNCISNTHPAFTKIDAYSIYSLSLNFLNYFLSSNHGRSVLFVLPSSNRTPSSPPSTPSPRDRHWWRLATTTTARWLRNSARGGRAASNEVDVGTSSHSWKRTSSLTKDKIRVEKQYALCWFMKIHLLKLVYWF